MLDKVNVNSFLGQIDAEKKAKFEQWCQQKHLDINHVISLLIDCCLEENGQIINNLLTNNHPNLTRNEIESMIVNILQPVISRLDSLEKQLQNKDRPEIFLASNTKQKTDNNNLVKKEELNITNSLNQTIEEEKRKYLPRHQIWQMLKQTDYIKYGGYDSFLVATPEQFIEYGIFFDVQKKRYYVLIDPLKPQTFT